MTNLVKNVAGKNSVTGSWLGNYYYKSSAQPSGFEAVFIEENGSIEGSILDDGNLGEANVFGKFADPIINFTKKYKNPALQPITYEGTLTDEGKKITGTWRIGNLTSGNWLAWRQDEEEIPDLDRETEDDQELEGELVRERVMIRPRTQQQQR